MKKIYILLTLVTGLVFAQAQQTGVNTTSPQATLDVTAKTDNTTAEVEGLLIPRVSKQKALLMAGSTPKESTMIYVNDLSDFVDPADGTENRVAQITDNGFYHWNGSVWVKSSGKDGSEWVYDADTEKIHLRRSNTTNEFNNKVYYDKSGKFFNYQSDSIDMYNYATNVWDYRTIDEINAANYLQRSSINLEDERTTSSNPNIGEVFSKYLRSNQLYATETDVTKNHQLIATINGVRSLRDNSVDYLSLRGQTGSVWHQGTGNVSYLIGSAGGARIINGSSNGYVMGVRSAAQSHTPGSVNQVVTYGAYPYIGERSGDVNNFNILYGNLYHGENNNSTVGTSAAIDIGQSIGLNTTSTINMAMGLRYRGFYGENTATINKNYGILLENIDEGAENWAIYTNAGLNSFGDDVQVRNIKQSTDANDQILVADAEGVIKTTNTNFGNLSLWKFDNDKVFLDEASIIDRVEYLREGGYRHYPKDIRDVVTYDDATNTIVTTPLDINQSLYNNAYNLNYTYSDLIKENFVAENYPNKSLNNNSLIVDEKENSTIINRIYLNRNRLEINPNSNKDWNSLVTNWNELSYKGQGNVRDLRSGYNAAIAYSGNVNQVTGSYNQAGTKSVTDIKNMSGSTNLVTLTGVGQVDNVDVTRSNMYLGYNNTVSENKVMDANGSNVNLQITDKFLGSVEDLIAYNYNLDLNVGATPNIKNMYGLKLDDVSLGSVTNHAIYTNAGLNSFGDDVEVRQGHVKVEDGVILTEKTGTGVTVGGACTELGKITFQDDNFYGCKSTGWVLLNN